MQPRSKRLVFALVTFALVALSLVGMARVLGDSYLLALNRAKWRPVLLHFGVKEHVGHCITRETDDPTSDVLANLIDVDADGRPDFRISADALGTHHSCEVRWLWLWLDRDDKECRAAISSCR